MPDLYTARLSLIFEMTVSFCYIDNSIPGTQTNKDPHKYGHNAYVKTNIGQGYCQNLCGQELAPIIGDSLADFIKGTVTITTGPKKSSLKLPETGGSYRRRGTCSQAVTKRDHHKLASTKTYHCLCVRCGGSRLCLAF